MSVCLKKETLLEFADGELLSGEMELAERFLKLPPRSDDKLTRWQQYAQILLASNELMYVD